MYPTAPILFRECTKDWQIPDTDITLYKGTIAYLPIYGLQHDPKYFPEPEKFKPERFSDKSTTFVERPYLSFGLGPRACIGLRFAKLSSKVGLTLMLKNFNFQLAGNTLKPLVMNAGSILLTPNGGLQFKVTKRI